LTTQPNAKIRWAASVVSDIFEDNFIYTGGVYIAKHRNLEFKAGVSDAFKKQLVFLQMWEGKVSSMYSPDAANSQTRTLKDVQQEVIDVLLEIDNVKFQENPQIIAKYAKLIGYLENDLLNWQLKSRRAKRKFELAKAAANRGKSAIDEALEAQLEAEFAKWEAQLADRLEQQLKLLEKDATMVPLSPKDTRELKKLHKLVIKRLHPDLHPNLSEDAQRFFVVAQKAYEDGDLQTLRVVETATRDYETVKGEAVLSPEEQELEFTMAEAQLAIAKEQLETIKDAYPQTLKELLDSPIQIAARKKELEEEIAKQKEAARLYEEKIAALRLEGKK
jgi:hypothetical protein